MSRNHVTVRAAGISVTITYGDEPLDEVIRLATAAARELLEVQWGLKLGANGPPAPFGAKDQAYTWVAPPAATGLDGYEWYAAKNGSGHLWAVPRE